MESVSTRLSRLNPFAHLGEQDDEDIGDAIDSKTLAGGGHAGRETSVTHHLRVSTALRSFLVDQGNLSRENASIKEPDHLSETLRSLLNKPHAVVPASLTDRSHLLPDYFISSSHNTYLLAHQLYGASSAKAYETALRTGSRCVEIDAWDGDNKDEPKVTHGYTFTSSIPFRTVCETIRDVVDHQAAEAVNAQGYSAAPILLSLENHCDADGQQRMVDIMHEVFGDRLLGRAIRDKAAREQEGTGDHVTLAELGSKIAVIVEYHFPNDNDAGGDEATSSSEDEELEESRREYQRMKKAAPSAVIVPALSELGIYAQSVKPPNNAWFEEGILQNSPHHPLINISETGLLGHMPTHSAKIAKHNSNHLMRVYPKGTRISSANLNPVPFWAIGTQICALNWQTFGASMQLNEALFGGTDGYVLKPASLRNGGSDNAPTCKKRLTLHVAGATDIPIPQDRPQDGSDIKPYLTCTLVHPSHTVLTSDPPKRKTTPYKQHMLTGMLHKGPNPPNTEPLWNETLEWEYEDDELVFLRLLIKSDDAFAANPNLVVRAVRLLYVQRNEWVFIRMLNLKGQETRCSLLVKFEIWDI